jgi:hypothetical protein
VAVWNHIYSTADPAGGCEVSITNQDVYIDVPVYVTGDLCITGTRDRIWERPGGQAVDVRVGGRLVLANSNTSVGWNDGQGNVNYITSAGIHDGCSTTVTGTLYPCTNGSFQYYVKAGGNGAFQALQPPAIDTTWYSRADPGPAHGCKSGSNIPYVPGTTTPIPGGVAAPALANTVFESTGNTAADRSVTTPFDLTPTSSYTCLSQSGTGELAWVYDASNHNGKLYISGVVYIDGNVFVSHSGQYDGMAALYVGGTYSMGGAGLALCAVPNCTSGGWNPNTEMLMVVALGPGNAVDMTGGADIFQGGLFADKNSTIALNGWAALIQGPLVAGRFVFNQLTAVYPLPVINKLPPGAPLAVNARAVPLPPQFVNG